MNINQITRSYCRTTPRRPAPLASPSPSTSPGIVHNKRAARCPCRFGIIFFAVLVAGVVPNKIYLRPRHSPQRASLTPSSMPSPTSSQNPHRQHPPLPQNTPAAFELHRRSPAPAVSTKSCSLTPTASAHHRRAGPQGGRRARPAPAPLNRTVIELGASPAADCIAITFQRHHLPPEAILLDSPSPWSRFVFHTTGIP